MVKSKDKPLENEPLKKVPKDKNKNSKGEEEKVKEKAGAKVKKEGTEEDLKKRTSDRSVLIKEIKEKAKKLQEKIEGVDTGVIKEELDKKRQLLIPLEDYVKTGIHLGTRVITPDMKKFVYRRRADSIGVLNTSLIDEHIKKAIDFMSKYSPEEVVLICKRESGWQAAILFSKATGIKVFTKKYPAGMMTNTQLEAFYEPELVIVTDPWVDRNSLNDALKTGKKILMLADTNNFIKKADHIIPCNNKGGKSLGLVYYLLAKGYIEKRKMSDDSLESMNSFIAYDGQEE